LALPLEALAVDVAPFADVLALAAGLLGAAFLAAGLLDAAFLAAGLGAGLAAALVAGALTGDLEGAGVGADAATGSSTFPGSSAAAGSVEATPIELESVRWHVSHVMIVRTRVPSWCSSRRRVRGLPQKLQYATSVVTLTWPGRLFMSALSYGKLSRARL
jgi:hypothetical protein